jgi:ABC-type antimicrobial peptide transport system permease subunit
VLTVLAVILASALLSALLTIAGTAESRVLDQLANGGPLSGVKVLAAAPDPAEIDQDNPPAGEPRAIDDDTIARFRSLPGVSRVFPVVRAGVFVVSADVDGGARIDPFGTAMVGVDLRRPGQLPVSVLAGRVPVADATAEVAVSEGYLRQLGLEKTEAEQVLGGEVEVATPRRVRAEGEGRNRRGIRSRFNRYVIVGVVAQDAAGGDLLVPLDVAASARAWTLGGIDGGASFDASQSPYGGAFVVADGIGNVGRVRDGITAVGYSTSAPENLLASVQRYIHVVEIVLAAVGLIALVVSALGIANAMLAAVRERRREIGVLKAIGARDRDVLRMFVIEASVLGLLGGLIGTALGYVVAQVVAGVVNGYLVDQGLSAVSLVTSPLVVVGTVVGATLLATLGGAVPARRAAQLPARHAVGAL